MSKQDTSEFFEPHRQSDFFEDYNVSGVSENTIKSSKSGNRRQIVSMEYDIVKKEIIISYEE